MVDVTIYFLDIPKYLFLYVNDFGGIDEVNRLLVKNEKFNTPSVIF